MPISALSKPVVHDATKAVLSHHVVQFYGVDLLNQQTNATLASYAAVGAAQPVGHITVKVAGLPVGDPVQWLYEQLLETAGEANALAGAVPVLDDANGAAGQGD